MDVSVLIYWKGTIPWLGLEALEGLFSLNFFDAHRYCRFKQPPWEGTNYFFFVPTPMSLWNFSSWIYGINKFMNNFERSPRSCPWWWPGPFHPEEGISFSHGVQGLLGLILQESQLGDSCSGSGSSTWPCSTLELQGLVPPELWGL